MRWGAYIGETIELLNVFEHAHPSQKLAAIQTYSCSFYGSNLWDLFGPAANQLYRAWQISVRDAWGVPRPTRTYILDHLLSVPFPHVKQLILRRYIKFVKVLVSSMNPVISALSYWGARTRCSTTGRNVANLQEEFSVYPLAKTCSPTSLSVSPREMPENGQEIIELLERLFSIKASETEPDVVAEISQLIDDTCNGR